MSDQRLDLRRSLHIVRRHLAAVGISAALGLLAGAGVGELSQPMHTSNALVALPSSTSAHTTPTQILIVSSNPVLAGALRNARPAMSLRTLSNRVQVSSLTPDVISITAEGGTPAEAEATANAVADSYVAYVGSASTPGGAVPAQVLAKATNATATRPLARIIVTACLGALLGLIIGAVGALGAGRNDRQLRRRDEIADAIGVPVVASIPVRHPANAARWIKLLEEYEPSAADAWRLRSALEDVKLAGLSSPDGSAGFTLTFLSLACDQRALALGPQLAVLAASLGIRTVLVVGPGQDASVTAALRAAATTPPSSRRSSQLRLAVADSDDEDHQGDDTLSVVVTVVDDQNPRIAYPAGTNATVLGVSAGAATAGQLARVAASAAANGRYIAGILVADPDPADVTTGRLPQLARPARRQMPTRLTGTLR